MWIVAALAADRAVASGFDDVIPAPASILAREGACAFDPRAPVVADPPAADAVRWLRDRTAAAGPPTLAAPLVFRTDPSLGAEAYVLQLTPKGITARASGAPGFVYAVATLLQLLPLGGSGAVPCGEIIDAPRFAWRGFMLDTARRYYPVASLERLLDLLAQHKLNVFHWHLTDDEGWRLDIPAYPRLAAVGGRRGPGTALPHDVIPGVRAIDQGQVHAGVYTRADVERVVAFARSRAITVIPEIDVPGHAKAAVVSYPELLQDPADPGAYRSVQHVPHGAMDPGLDSTYTFLEAILTDVAEWFPDAPYIHLGGDEVPAGAWVGSPAAQERARALGLGSVRDLQGVFFTRLEEILAARGRHLLGWQEVATAPGSARAPGGAIVAWADVPAATRAARAQGLSVILAPAATLYFDAKYVDTPQEPGQRWAGATDTREVYEFEPLTPPDVHLLGIEACLWSEKVRDEAMADYLIWPRALALAEVAWSPNRRWDTFHPRLERYLPRLAAQGVRYRPLSPGSGAR